MWWILSVFSCRNEHVQYASGMILTVIFFMNLNKSVEKDYILLRKQLERWCIHRESLRGRKRITSTGRGHPESVKENKLDVKIKCAVRYKITILISNCPQNRLVANGDHIFRRPILRRCINDML